MKKYIWLIVIISFLQVDLFARKMHKEPIERKEKRERTEKEETPKTEPIPKTEPKEELPEDKEIKEPVEVRPEEGVARVLPERVYEECDKETDTGVRNLKKYHIHDHYYFCARRMFIENHGRHTIKIDWCKCKCSPVKCFPWKHKWNFKNVRDAEVFFMFSKVFFRLIAFNRTSTKSFMKNYENNQAVYERMLKSYEKECRWQNEITDEHKMVLFELSKQFHEFVWKEFEYDYYDLHGINSTNYKKTKNIYKWNSVYYQAICTSKEIMKIMNYNRGYNVLTERWEPEIDGGGMLIDRIDWTKEYGRFGWKTCFNSFEYDGSKNWKIKKAWEEEKRHLEKKRKK